ncbi:MAG: M15 family metallopeptidase [Candidatus Nomurabacteria bacterium]|nr:MAG: M15 family metallopeptidase [Candidatus Nomurabacteria bacterium]HRV75814.1 M15 family metallopeptidase [Candidatus Saccharimonadales bacterium]
MVSKAFLRKLLVTSLIILLFSSLAYFLRSDKKNESNNTQQAQQNEDAEKKVEETKKTQLDIKSPTSQYVLVNKTYALNPEDYKPGDLVIPKVQTSSSDSRDEQSIREIIRPSLEKMLNDAKSAKLDLVMNSGFRSFKSQSFYFNNYVKQYGLEEAKKFSAEPGHSEHQTGLAFDLSYKDKKCYLEVCFGDTQAGKWLADNSYKYGFILRYPDGKTDITGYQYEPWHFRYVGKDIAKEIFEKRITYEEYLSSLSLIAL